MSVRLHDPVSALPYVAAASPEEVDAALASLSRPVRPAELLARALIWIRRHEQNHDPDALAHARADYAEAAYPGPERIVVGSALIAAEIRGLCSARSFGPIESARSSTGSIWTTAGPACCMGSRTPPPRSSTTRTSTRRPRWPGWTR